MMNNFKLLFGLVLLSACGGGKNNVKEKEPEFVSEKILVDLSYPEYTDTSVVPIMTGLGLCDPATTTLTPDTTKKPPCSHELFRVFQNRRHGKYRDGFLIEVKKGVFSPQFRVLNVHYSNSTYSVTNDYVGELLEMRTKENGNYDLVIRYFDPEIGTVAILHEWRTNHYEPVTVTEINDHFVRPEKSDSIDNIYIREFPWGY